MTILQRLYLKYIICNAALRYYFTRATVATLGSREPNPECFSGAVVVDIRLQLMSMQVPSA